MKRLTYNNNNNEVIDVEIIGTREYSKTYQNSNMFSVYLVLFLGFVMLFLALATGSNLTIFGFKIGMIMYILFNINTSTGKYLKCFFIVLCSIIL